MEYMKRSGSFAVLAWFFASSHGHASTIGSQRSFSSSETASTLQTRVIAATPPLRWTVIFMTGCFSFDVLAWPTTAGLPVAGRSRRLA
jgi:hypothetical protein